jgi:hypothetical protein
MRLLRSTWVLLTNGLSIYMMYLGVSQVVLLNDLLEQDNKNKTLWLHFALRIIVPVLGILLEFLGSRFAKWVNVGFFVLVGSASCAISVWAWSDYHGHVLLLIGIAAFAVAIVDYLLYHGTRSALVRFVR